MNLVSRVIDEVWLNASGFGPDAHEDGVGSTEGRSMTTLAADRAERITRKAERALTVATVLGVVEILRRSPRWLMILTGLLAFYVVMLAVIYIVWVEVTLGSIVAWKLAHGAIRGWRERR